MKKIRTEPESISQEYNRGTEYKSSLGSLGLYEQTTRNERFYIGDQWHGAKCGNTRPLVRRNIIKRIGEYKMSVITASPVAVNYSADGVPDTTDIREQSREITKNMYDGIMPEGEPDAAEVSAVTSAMSDYFRVTAERVKFDAKKEEVLRNAYISGTGILFTYWDGDIETGLYADEGRTKAIKGDIACEVLGVENVNFGDPNNPDVQSQPYIIIAQRRDTEEVKREARRNRLPDDDIIPDRDGNDYLSTDISEPTDSRRVTVYTKLYKEWDENGKCRVMAVRVTEKAYVRKPWCLMLKNYPIASFCWERRRQSAYGESEITYLIPNQIAINRALTAAVWGLMQSGMPIMLVNNDSVPGPITNDPGQIIRISCAPEDSAQAIRYLQPPQMAAQFQNTVNDLCANTLSDSGANDAALGNLRPDNATAIIQMREAATAPMQIYMNRFYDFIEDVARIWADFWLNLYGDRSLKTEGRDGTRYLPFKAKRYKSLLITARVDVGAATMYSEAVVISTLDNLLKSGLITFDQYLERLPGGMIPDITGLREDLKAAVASAPGGEASDEELIKELKANYPEQYERFMQMTPEEQSAILAQLKGGQTAQPQGVTQEVADL